MSEMVELHERLMADERALDRLRELRGWTASALRTLGLGFDGDRIVIPVLDADGVLSGVLRYQPNPDRRNGRPKTLQSPGTRRELFPPPELLPEEGTIWLVEGEPDAVAATSVGLVACGIPGSQSWQSEWAERFAGRDVVVCCDCDQPGRSLAARAATDLAEHATVRVVDLAGARDDGYDLSDLVKETDGWPEDARPLLERMANNAAIHLPESERPPRPALTVADWRRALTDYLDADPGSDAAWPIPFASLCEATDGGLRPGQLVVLAGYTSHCKSVYGDMILDLAAEKGARCGLYMTEMTIVMRGLRRISRDTGIPISRLRLRNLSRSDRLRAQRAIDALPYPASVVTDWHPRHVMADIRATRKQVAVVDLLHGFHYQDERQLASFVETFAQAAMTDAAGVSGGCAVVLVCHLNDQQMQGARSARKPKPGMHSLKGATAIKQRADLVMFSWLEDDDDGVPGLDGEVWIAKSRDSGMARQLTRLDPTSFTLRERFE